MRMRLLQQADGEARHLIAQGARAGGDVERLEALSFVMYDQNHEAFVSYDTYQATVVMGSNGAQLVSSQAIRRFL